MNKLNELLQEFKGVAESIETSPELFEKNDIIFERNLLVKATNKLNLVSYSDKAAVHEVVRRFDNLIK